MGHTGHPPAVDDRGPALVSAPGSPGQHRNPGEHVDLRLCAPDDPAGQSVSGQSPTSWNNRESVKLETVTCTLAKMIERNASADSSLSELVLWLSWVLLWLLLEVEWLPELSEVDLGTSVSGLEKSRSQAKPKNSYYLKTDDDGVRREV